MDVVTQWPAVNKISFVAHSLGGLVARYAVGRLYQHQGGKIAGLEPINFITVATPHLGSVGNKQVHQYIKCLHLYFFLCPFFLKLFFFLCSCTLNLNVPHMC